MIKLNSCRKCGGKGTLVSFDCTYNVKYKSLNFLKNGDGFNIWAECKNCKRFTEKSKIPLDVIEQWNNGEMYSNKEWSDKLNREYVGKVYSEYEIKNYILKTDFEKNSIEFTMADTSYETIYFNKTTNSYLMLFDCSLEEKNINGFINNLLEYFQNNKLKVVAIRHIKSIV